MRVFVSWSGGKDSCLACHRAVRQGHKVIALLNMASEEGDVSRSHGLSSAVLKAQAEAMGVPLVQRETSWDEYEDNFKDAVRELKRNDVEGGVFGDIDLEEHREWVVTTCAGVSVKPHLPLWGEDQAHLLEEFLAEGYEAMVVAVKADLLDETWPGRIMDRAFLEDIAQLSGKRGITPSGEAGEYHTLVTAGPLFSGRIEVLDAAQELRDGYRFLRIDRHRLVNR